MQLHLLWIIQPLLLSETHDAQQCEHQDGEGEGPYEDAGKQVQGLTWKSQQDQHCQLQLSLTTINTTDVKPESSPEHTFVVVELLFIVSSAQQARFWFKKITSVWREIL